MTYLHYCTALLKMRSTDSGLEKTRPRLTTYAHVHINQQMKEQKRSNKNKRAYACLDTVHCSEINKLGTVLLNPAANNEQVAFLVLEGTSYGSICICMCNCRSICLSLLILSGLIGRVRPQSSRYQCVRYINCGSCEMTGRRCRV